MKSTLSLLVMAVLLSYSSATNNPVALRSPSSVIVHSDENNIYRSSNSSPNNTYDEIRKTLVTIMKVNSSTAYNDDNGGSDSEASIGKSLSDINWDDIKVSSSVIGAFLGGTICLILLYSLILILHCGNRKMSDRYENLINSKKKKKRLKMLIVEGVQVVNPDALITALELMPIMTIVLVAIMDQYILT